MARIETKSPWNSWKFVKFVAEKAGRILATNCTNCHEKPLEFVQIGEIRGRKSWADSCHIEHKERKDAANLRIFCHCFVFYAFLVINRPPNSELLRPNFAS
ncbi:MAG: hypothetical protein WAW20_00840 [Anaerolineae bacterium]